MQRLGYAVIRQTGSHIRMRRGASAVPVTVPNHRPIRVGTLNTILSDVADELGITREELLRRLKL